MIMKKEEPEDFNGNLQLIFNYDQQKPARIPNELYKYKEVHFNLKNIRYFRLLVMISQNAATREDEPDLFKSRDYTIKRNVLFKYLGLSTSKRNYELVQKLEEELQNNMPFIQIKQQGKKKINYLNIEWFEYFGYDEKTDTYKYRLTETATPYITSLKRYNKVTPYIANLLESTTQAWLYPWLKSGVNLNGLLEIDIEDLMEQLIVCPVDSENNSIYTKYDNSTTRFFNKILGIRKKKDGIVRKAMEISYVEMELNDNPKKGSCNLYNIVEKTDLKIKVWAKRQDRKYIGLAFDVAEKENFVIPSSLCKPQKELESSPKNNPTSSKENQPEKDLVKRNYVSVKEETKQVKNILTQSHIDCKPNSVLSNPLNQREGLSYEEMKKKMNEFSDVDAKNGINFRLTNVKQFAKLMGYPNFDEKTRMFYRDVTQEKKAR